MGAALKIYAEKGDFADLLHFALAQLHGATEFATFDKGFVDSPAGGTTLTIL